MRLQTLSIMFSFPISFVMEIYSYNRSIYKTLKFLHKLSIITAKLNNSLKT